MLYRAIGAVRSKILIYTNAVEQRVICLVGVGMGVKIYYLKLTMTADTMFIVASTYLSGYRGIYEFVLTNIGLKSTSKLSLVNIRKVTGCNGSRTYNSQAFVVHFTNCNGTISIYTFYINNVVALLSDCTSLWGVAGCKTTCARA